MLVEFLVLESILLLLFKHLFDVFFKRVERNFLAIFLLAFYLFFWRIVCNSGGLGIFLLDFTLFI